MNLANHRFHSGKPDGPDATQVQPSNWNEGHVFVGGLHGSTLVRDTTDLVYGATWRPDGIWVNVPYDPADFFAADGGVTWDVPLGSVQVHRYALVGFTMRLHIAVGGNLSGATSGLRIKMPTGYNLASYGVSPLIYQNNSGNTYGYILFNPAFPNQIIINKLNNEAWATGTALTYVMVTIEVVSA